MVASAEAGLPMVAVAAPAAPAPAAEEEQEDKPWWEDAAGALGDAASWTGGQIVGFGKGVGEGVVGIGEGGLMPYRLSVVNAVIDPESHEREWDNVANAAEFAWNNPASSPRPWPTGRTCPRAATANGSATWAPTRCSP